MRGDMFSQPFAVLCDCILCSPGSQITLRLNLKMGTSMSIERVAGIPCVPGGEYVGCAIDSGRSELCVADAGQERLVTVGVDAIGKPAGDAIVVALQQSPRSVAFARGRFWFTGLVNEFTTQIISFDPETRKVERLAVEEGWGSQQVNLDGYPLVLSHRGDVALFNPMCRQLLWLSEDGCVIDRIELDEDVQVGPTGRDEICVMQRSDGRALLCLVDSRHAVVAFRQWHRTPWREACGVAVTDTGSVVVLDRDLSLFLATKNGTGWQRCDFDFPRLNWEGLLEQAERGAGGD
jgi:hypothetical protein